MTVSTFIQPNDTKNSFFCQTYDTMLSVTFVIMKSLDVKLVAVY